MLLGCALCSVICTIMAAANRRKSIPLDTKRDVIRRRDDGLGIVAIGRIFGLAESSVRTILKNREEILKTISAYGSSVMDNRKHVSSELIKMERYLCLWISRKESEGVPLDKRQIKDQALCFYKVICEKANQPLGSFNASNGWLQRFLKRKNIHNVKLSGEQHSADANAASKFPELFKGLIEEEGFHPDAIYNCDEAGLVYKRMPKSTYIAKTVKKARGRKGDMLRFTVLFCVNQSGSHKVKPLVVHTAKHPRCYNHLSSMKDAPVYWMDQPSAWITAPLMKKWVLQMFVPEARRKCRRDGREFRVCLVMDNCRAHPEYLQDIHPNVEVVFLPPNTTSLIQPLDQELIANVKTIYYRNVFRDLRSKTESNVEIQMILQEDDNHPDQDIDDPDDPGDPDDPPPSTSSAAAAACSSTSSAEASACSSTSSGAASASSSNDPRMTVHQYWRQFTVKDAVDHLVKAWDAISIATVRHAWKKLTPHLCQGEEAGPVQVLADVMAETVEEARELPGFSEVTTEEMAEVTESTISTTQDVVGIVDLEDALVQEMSEEREGERPDPSVPSMANISAILAAADSFKECVIANERCPFRRSELCLSISKNVSFYKQLHVKKIRERKQTLITRYLGNSSYSSSVSDSPSVEELFRDDSQNEEFEGFLEEVEAHSSGSTPHGVGSQ